jgi:hypothetical protein
VGNRLNSLNALGKSPLRRSVERVQSRDHSQSTGFRFLCLTAWGFESRRSHVRFSSVRSTTRKPEGLWGPLRKLIGRFRFRAGERILLVGQRARSVSGRQSCPVSHQVHGRGLSRGSRTTSHCARSAGAEVGSMAARQVRLRDAVAPADTARAGSSPTTRSAGSGATLRADHPPRAALST